MVMNNPELVAFNADSRSNLNSVRQPSVSGDIWIITSVASNLALNLKSVPGETGQIALQTHIAFFLTYPGNVASKLDS